MIEAFKWFLERVCEYHLRVLSSWSNFLEALGQIPRVFTNFSNGLAWPYLLSSLALAWVIYVVAERRAEYPACRFVSLPFHPVFTAIDQPCWIAGS